MRSEVRKVAYDGSWIDEPTMPVMEDEEFRDVIFREKNRGSRWELSNPAKALLGSKEIQDVGLMGVLWYHDSKKRKAAEYSVFSVKANRIK